MGARQLFTKVVPVKAKVALAKILSNDLTGHFFNAIYRHRIPFHGTVIDTSNSQVVKPQTASDLVLKIYERAEIDQVRSYLVPDYDVIELGGSIGVNTMQIRKKMGAGKRLITVEASPSLANIFLITHLIHPLLYCI